ncbi:MAG: flagellar M-ring protein FliF [Firmicutes bacterium]|nr:flagellar M-ring protein FliF [Bacillota bacterium]
MREQLTKLKENATKFWQESSPNRKLLVAGLALLVIIGVSMGIWGITRSSPMVALYTDLESNDAAAIVAKLKELKVTYEIADNGATIMVPTELRDQARLDLAAAGLPKGVAGFESLSETRFGETTRDKEVRYILALQSELARTIKQLKGIEQAWVYLTVPQEALFAKDQQDRTASVIVKLSSGAELEPQQVMGIVHLVSRSVESLKPENITVVDSTGQVLSEDLPGMNKQTNSRLSLQQMDIQKQFEKDLAQSVQSMLEKVLGYNKSVVRVRAELDFDQQEIVQTQWGPNKFVRSAENNEEITTSQNTAAPVEGVGTPSNIPGNPTYPNANGETSNYSQQKTYSAVNNEIDKLETHRVVAPGKVRLLDVAVMVDNGEMQVEENQIRDAVTRAAGIRTDRGDQISVSLVKFDTSYWDKLQGDIAAEERQAAIIKWSIIGAVILAFILVGFIVYQTIRRRREQGMLDATIGEPILVEELLGPEDTMSPEEREKAKLRETIEQLAREKPEDVAQLVRSWLTEDLR